MLLGVVFVVAYWVAWVMMPVGVVDRVWGPRSQHEIREEWACSEWRDYSTAKLDGLDFLKSPQERDCRFTRLLHDYEFRQIRFVDEDGSLKFWSKDFRGTLNTPRAWLSGIALFGIWALVTYALHRLIL
jgi:hypothetical protein